MLYVISAAAQPGQGQPGQASGDLQSQWAEYYRQLGYAYYGGGQPGGAQQGGGQQPSPSAGGGGVGGGAGGPEPKVCIAHYCMYRWVGFGEVLCDLHALLSLSFIVNCVMLMHNFASGIAILHMVL